MKIKEVLHTDIEVTVIIVNIQTDWAGQTVQTKIRLLLKEQFDQGLHCLSIRLHFYGYVTLW